MFSGMVAATGEVRVSRPAGGGLRLEVRGTCPGGPLVGGESIAVQGVCLTVSGVLADGFGADVSPESLARTNLRALRAGQRVNLERALRMGDRIGGHLVSGHVDASVEVLAVHPQRAFRTLRLALPAALDPEVAEKGSVAVDGVSLTVSALEAGWFEVAAIPATLDGTTLGERRAGDTVNLETDLLAKYVRRALGGRQSSLARLLAEGGWNAEG